MSLVVGVVKRTAMVHYGASRVLIPNFIVTNIPPRDWADYLESSACMFQIPVAHITDLAINFLEGDAYRVELALPKKASDTKEAIVDCF